MSGRREEDRRLTRDAEALHSRLQQRSSKIDGNCHRIVLATAINTDETPYPVQDQTCQVWIASDPQSTVVVVAGSRGTAMIDM